jgi:hypothetical protein
MCDHDCTPADAEVSVTPGATATHSDAPTPLEARVVELLRRDELARVDFVAGPTVVSQAELRARACEIERNLLHVIEVDQPPAGDASYQSADPPQRATPRRPGVTALMGNTLYVKTGIDLDLVLKRALVLHEMVHATQDATRIDATLVEAEVAAFTAQAMVFMVFGTTWSGEIQRGRQPVDPTLSEEAARAERDRRSALDALVRATESAARDLFGRGRGAAMTTEQMDQVSTALGGIAYYAAHIHDGTYFDGISPLTRAVGRGGRRR